MISRLTIAVAGLLLALPANADIIGKPRVFAADRLEVGTVTVRLYGIVVPAPDQTFRWRAGRCRAARSPGPRSWT